jgi:hypothetical protein
MVIPKTESEELVAAPGPKLFPPRDAGILGPLPSPSCGRKWCKDNSISSGEQVEDPAGQRFQAKVEGA